jgi:hypothetical protein
MDDKTIDEKKVFIDLKKVFNQKNPKTPKPQFDPFKFNFREWI